MRQALRFTVSMAFTLCLRICKLAAMRSMIVMELSCIVSTFIVILRNFSDFSSASSVPLFSVLLYFTFPLLMPAPVLLSGSQSSTFLMYVSQNTQSCLPGPSTYVRSTPFSLRKSRKSRFAVTRPSYVPQHRYIFGTGLPSSFSFKSSAFGSLSLPFTLSYSPKIDS